jgi:hypothetical protein
MSANQNGGEISKLTSCRIYRQDGESLLLCYSFLASFIQYYRILEESDSEFVMYICFQRHLQRCHSSLLKPTELVPASTFVRLDKNARAVKAGNS